MTEVLIEHTPEPWEYGEAEMNRGARMIYFPGKNGRVLAYVALDRLAPTMEEAEQRRDANARLIVTAPRMIAILRELARPDYDPAALDDARQLLREIPE